MSTLKTNALGSTDFPYDVLIDGVANLKRVVTSSASAPASPANGNVWYDTSASAFKIYLADDWYKLAATAVATGTGSRGVFGGGLNSSDAEVNVMDYITVASLGNGTDFGDLLAVNEYLAGFSSGSRGVFGGGRSGGSELNVIQYITIASTGNATDFGDLDAVRQNLSGASDTTRGLFFGGGSSSTNVIQYITIASTGNATDFGDLTVGSTLNAATAGFFRAINATASTNYTTNVLNYVTISTTGNATDFGNLTVARYGMAGCSNGTLGLFGGGKQSSGYPTDVIDQISIPTAANATDFGNLTIELLYASSFSDGTKGVWGGGAYFNGSAFAVVNTIQYVTFSTVGNATDFGDLTLARDKLAGFSGT